MPLQLNILSLRPSLVFISLLCGSLLLAGCQTNVGKSADDDGLSETKLMQLGRNAENRGDKNTALAFYRQANIVHPDAVAPVRALSRSYAEFGAYQDSANAYGRLAELVKDAEKLPARLEEGRMWLRAREPDSAEKAFLQAVALDGSSVQALNGLGVSRNLLGRNDEARESYDAVLARMPDHAPTLNNKALSLLITGNALGAIEILEPLVRKHAEKPSYLRNLAMAHGMKGNIETSRKILISLNETASLENNLRAFEKLSAMTPKARADFIFNSQIIDMNNRSN